MKLGDRVKVMRGPEAYDEAVFWFAFCNGMLCLLKRSNKGEWYPEIHSPIVTRPDHENIEEDLPEWAL